MRKIQYVRISHAFCEWRIRSCDGKRRIFKSFDRGRNDEITNDNKRKYEEKKWIE